MSLKEDVESDIKKTVNTDLSTVERLSTVDGVPEPDKMGYSDGIYLPSTYLYADMADSSGLVAVAPEATVARVMKAYLVVSVRIIRANKGHIRSFDGDRVMGIFAGDDRFTRSIKAAMQINWAMRHLVQPAIASQFGSIQKSGWQLKHACGIASGKALLIRAGFRGNDDLVSIGAAPNLAAKLSDKREGSYRTYIGAGTYQNLNDAGRLSNGKNMWEGSYNLAMGGKTYSYYRSTYWWPF